MNTDEIHTKLDRLEKLLEDLVLGQILLYTTFGPQRRSNKQRIDNFLEARENLRQFADERSKKFKPSPDSNPHTS